MDSLYYPSCGFDGDPIRHLAGNIYSFVYVDYGYTESELEDAINHPGFSGYKKIATRKVLREELTPRGWTQRIVPATHDGDPINQKWYVKPPFCNWYIFERSETHPPSHGPIRFSLLFLCADGVAAFQALYSSNKLRPKAIAVIQPGEGFGGNWTYFGMSDQILARSVAANPAGEPDWLLFGGYGRKDGYTVPCWPQYARNICYLPKTEASCFGTIGLWERLTTTPR